jgi:Tol biopolymer transport system component
MGLHEFPYGKAMHRYLFLLLIALAALSITGCPSDDGTVPVVTSTGNVVYLADQDIGGVFELYLGGSGTKINPALPAGRTVVSFALTPDSTAVVYLADQDLDEVFELYRVNLATPGSSVKLNGALVTGGDVVQFAVTPDGSAVVYRADQALDEVFELFRTVLTGLANSRLNPAYGIAQDVETFVTLPNSSGVVYRADQDTDGVSELYRVLFASAPATDQSVPIRCSSCQPEGEAASSSTECLSRTEM